MRRFILSDPEGIKVMTKNENRFSVYLPARFWAGIDQEAERLKAENPGLKVTRADVIRMALIKSNIVQEEKP